MIKRLCLALAGLLLLTAGAWTQDVAQDELRSVSAQTIEFINYVGPQSQAVVSTIADLRDVGGSLGRAVAAGARQTGDRNRYFVIHAVDPATREGFDADILFLGPGVTVDHIANLRRIISGYLVGAYGYSQADADTLAVFITIYNAVYRSRMDYFSANYKAVVTAELTAANAGLALRWDQWAGRSRIVIPLGRRAGPGVIGSVSTTPITDPAVIENLRQETDDRAIEDRQNIVDIMERDVEQEQAAIDAERARIAEEQRRLEEANRAAQEGTITPPGDTAQVDTTVQTTTEPGDTQTGGIAETDAARAADQAARDAEAARLAEEAAALDERQAEVDAQQENIAEQRDEIADDQQAEIIEQIEAAGGDAENGTLLFELMNPLMPLSRLVLVDMTTGLRIRRSELNTIWAATAIDTGQAIVAVAGMATASGGVIRLVRVDRADFSTIIQAQEEVFADTMLWYYDEAVFAVIRQDGKWVIGRYDPVSLELRASSDAVSQWTFLSRAEGQLVAQSPSGAFIVMDAVTLKTAKELTP